MHDSFYSGNYYTRIVGDCVMHDYTSIYAGQAHLIMPLTCINEDHFDHAVDLRFSCGVIE